MAKIAGFSGYFNPVSKPEFSGSSVIFCCVVPAQSFRSFFIMNLQKFGRSFLKIKYDDYLGPAELFSDAEWNC